MQNPKSVQSLLDWLEQSGQLNKKHQAEAFILSQSNLSHPSLMVQMLLGFGALFGCGFIIGFLHLSNLINFNDTTSLSGAGIFFMLVALCLYALAKQNYSLIRLFLIQSAFMFIVVGKAFFIAGFHKFSVDLVPGNYWEVHHINPFWSISGGLLLTTLATYFLFPLALERALSCFLLLTSLMLNAIFDSYHSVIFFTFYCLLISGTFWLFIWQNRTVNWSPLAYASVITLLLMGAYLATVDNALNFDGFYRHSINPPIDIPLWVFHMVTGIALVGVCAALVKKNQAELFTSPIVLACLTILCLAFIANAGILLAIACLLLGYANHDRILMVLGILGLGLFLLLFYYNLPVSFVQRSQILAVSGLILLGARFFIKYQKWDRE